MKKDKVIVNYEELKQKLKISQGYMLFTVNSTPCTDCLKCGGLVKINECELVMGGIIGISENINGMSTYEIAMIIDNFLSNRLDVVYALDKLNKIHSSGLGELVEIKPKDER